MRDLESCRGCWVDSDQQKIRAFATLRRAGGQSQKKNYQCGCHCRQLILDHRHKVQSGACRHKNPDLEGRDPCWRPVSRWGPIPVSSQKTPHVVQGGQRRTRLRRDEVDEEYDLLRRNQNTGQVTRQLVERSVLQEAGLGRLGLAHRGRLSGVLRLHAREHLSGSGGRLCGHVTAANQGGCFAADSRCGSTGASGPAAHGLLQALDQDSALVDAGRIACAVGPFPLETDAEPHAPQHERASLSAHQVLFYTSEGGGLHERAELAAPVLHPPLRMLRRHAHLSVEGQFRKSTALRNLF